MPYSVSSARAALRSRAAARSGVRQRTCARLARWSAAAPNSGLPALRAVFERAGCAFAIAQAPSSEARDPITLGHPGAGTFGYPLRHCQRGGIVVLDIVAPCHALAPFGAGFGTERRIDPFQQRACAARIVVLILSRIAAEIDAGMVPSLVGRGRMRLGSVP